MNSAYERAGISGNPTVLPNGFPIFALGILARYAVSLNPSSFLQEFFIDGHVIADGQTVGFIGEGDDGQ